MFGKYFYLSILVLLSLGLVYFSCTRQPAKSVDFNADIRPILNTKCISCHGGVKESSGFSLFSREDALRKTDSGKPAIIPGNPDDSEIMRRLRSKDPEERMPYHAQPLDPEEIAKISDWIKEGAHWADHWAYIPPKTKPVPADDTGKAANPIDNFILDRLQQEGLQPSPRADKATLLRRSSLDLTGLPPTEKELQAFMQDKSPEAYEKQVDRLLASPQYGERWAAMWLDLARYSDTRGYEKDSYREVWRYRDYVIKSFNQDKPFNQFTVEQLAGDLLPKPTEEQLIATAYHRNTANNDEGGTDDEEFRTAAILDRVSNTWEVWQGTTMGCVQCHSHPYDPFKHEDFYKSMAFFNNTRDEDVPNESPTLAHFKPEDEIKINELKAWFQQQSAGQDAPKLAIEIEKLIKITEPKIHPHSFDQLTNAALIGDGKHLAGGHEGYARLKNIDLTGKTQLLINYGTDKEKGLVQIRKGSPTGEVIGSINLNKLEKKINIYNAGGFQKTFIDLKPTTGKHNLYFVFQNSTFANPQDYVAGIDWFIFLNPLPGADKPGFKKVQEDILALLNKSVERTPILQDSPAGYKRKTHVFDRGNWLTKGAEVQPETPGFMPAFANYPRNRLGLAQWFVSNQNPLTARVTVNRFWEQLFGSGLVETLEDFGSQGLKPSHPELLDWLAINFSNQQQWRVKQLLKLMVLSNTYQQASKTTPALTEKDPANKLLARGPRVRLTAEQIRDQALAVGGLLSLKMYGKSVMPPQPAGVWQVVYSGMQWKTSEGEDAHRRAIYTFWRRSSPYPSLMTFDAAGREICVSRRIRTNTPLQALVTLNDTVYLTAARGLAQQMLPVSAAVDKQVTRGYQLALFKKPSPQKVKVLTNLYSQAHRFYTQNPTEVNKFLGEKEATRKPESPKLAALTVVANAIMNLDEFVMKE